MASEDDILLTDRTTIETDQDCGMARWWYKEHGGRGMIPVEAGEHLVDGSQIHASLEAMARADCALAWAKEALLASPPATERAIRHASWCLAWAKWIEPRIRAQFETIFLEHEVIYDRHPLWIATTPDRGLKDRVSGQIVVVDYKSFGDATAYRWAAYWPYAAQVHIQIAAVEDELGEPVAYSLIRGVAKGHMEKGKLRHPYVYAWVKDGRWLADWAYGAELTLTTEYPEGLEAWIDFLGEEIGIAQFPLSQPVFKNVRLLDDLIAARTEREMIVKATRADCVTDRVLRATIFEPRYKKCRPMVGPACPYLAACHNAEVNRDPLASGLYIAREPHHDVERLRRPYVDLEP